jgi:hypothetical protein
MSKVCDGPSGPKKCGSPIEPGTGGTITIENQKGKIAYDLCDSCLIRLSHLIDPLGFRKNPSEPTIKTGS